MPGPVLSIWHALSHEWINSYSSPGTQYHNYLHFTLRRLRNLFKFTVKQCDGWSWMQTQIGVTVEPARSCFWKYRCVWWDSRLRLSPVRCVANLRTQPRGTKINKRQSQALFSLRNSWSGSFPSSESQITDPHTSAPPKSSLFKFCCIGSIFSWCAYLKSASKAL